MIVKKWVLLIAIASIVALSCKDDKKSQEILDNQLEQIEATEVVIDSTLNAVSEKAEEVESIIKEIDSI